MSSESLYKDVLLDHYRRPRNRGDLAAAQVVRRGSNPRCGDELEVGVSFEGDNLKKVEFRGRGCSVCLASASLMTEAVTGRSIESAERLYSDLQTWLGGAPQGDSVTLPESLQPLAAVRGHPARRRCVLLAWEALHDAIAAA
jgi:nitrogen fixation NifU-like protein